MKKVSKKLSALILGVSVLAMSTSAQAAATNGIAESAQSGDITSAIMEKVADKPSIHCLELFAALYLDELTTQRVESVKSNSGMQAMGTEASAQLLAPTPTPAPKQEAAATPKPVAKKKVTVNSAKSQHTVKAASAAKTVTTPSGKALSYKKVISLKATAYSDAPEENGGWGAVDYFGNPLVLGTVAVDPNVIPLGTTLYIEGYSSPGLPAKGMIAKATDMGGAIKGNRIDIFIPGSKKQVSDFGFQNVKAYILNQ